ncbi:uncharacterized protein LOC115099816 [Rhinatrema bivittatum]|uniref:uncharacterized protein LOC115099816 n=1 Tax=Rhinatrema bivittatum TaxID=194408 RepID=UPI001128A6B6|nr:uncharacterized protein LOC115099816 [Rhinatrema bivittatum]
MTKPHVETVVGCLPGPEGTALESSTPQIASDAFFAGTSKDTKEGIEESCIAGAGGPPAGDSSFHLSGAAAVGVDPCTNLQLRPGSAAFLSYRQQRAEPRPWAIPKQDSPADFGVPESARGYPEAQPLSPGGGRRPLLPGEAPWQLCGAICLLPWTCSRCPIPAAPSPDRCGQGEGSAGHQGRCRVGRAAGFKSSAAPWELGQVASSRVPRRSSGSEEGALWGQKHLKHQSQLLLEVPTSYTEQLEGGAMRLVPDKGIVSCQWLSVH